MDEPVAIEVEAVRRRLEAGDGGYEIVHTSPGLELGVYVLVAPEPDRQQPHEDDEVYVVLDGTGVLMIEGSPCLCVPARPSSCRREPTTSSPRTRA